MENLNTGTHLVTDLTTILSATTSTKHLIKTIHATNVFSADTSFNLSWVDTTASETFHMAFNVTIPQGSSFQALDGTFTLDNNDYIQSNSGNVNAIDLSISYMEITNTEG
jgi:hypothetical protein